MESQVVSIVEIHSRSDMTLNSFYTSGRCYFKE